MSDHDIDPTSPRMAPKPEVTKIAGRELKPSTLMMGHGYDPVLSEGSLKPPMASAISKASPASARAARTVSSIRASTRPTRRSSKIASRCGTAPKTR